MPEYRQGKDYFQNYGKRIVKAVTASAVGLLGTGVLIDKWWQFKYDVSNGFQYFSELSQAVQKGSVNHSELLSLAPMTLCCLVPIGILGLILEKSRKH